jgi:hypothetical protein
MWWDGRALWEGVWCCHRQPGDLAQHLAVFQAALPGSRGEAYLHQRGIPLALAQQLGVGYAAPDWPGSSSAVRWPARRRCGTSGWQCLSPPPMGGIRMSTRPG